MVQVGYGGVSGEVFQVRRDKSTYPLSRSISRDVCTCSLYESCNQTILCSYRPKTADLRQLDVNVWPTRSIMCKHVLQAGCLSCSPNKSVKAALN